MRLMMQSCNIKNLLIQNVQSTEKFATFDIYTDALHLLLGEFLHKNQKYNSFWRVCGNIFVFSHGQSAIERGFSINKQLLVDNLQEKSSVSQQIVYDHINYNEIKVQENDLSSGVLKSCRLANSRYITALEKVRK